MFDGYPFIPYFIAQHKATYFFFNVSISSDFLNIIKAVECILWAVHLTVKALSPEERAAKIAKAACKLLGNIINCKIYSLTQFN